MIETVSASLTERLLHRIQSAGPMTFAEFMRSALYDPSDGYYCRDSFRKWGREGDYRTSPERSELFAATFARYFARLYHDLGQPFQWTIVETGAGSGHFARGVLQTLSRYFPDVFAGTSYVIDEVSLSAQQQCREVTNEFADRIEFARVGSVTLDPGVVFSNELLDAFPVHRVTVDEGGLKEFFVDVDVRGKFAWSLQSPSTPELQNQLDMCETKLREGQIAEICLELENWFKHVTASLKSGCVVTVDYGASARQLHACSTDDPRYKGTLRGFSKHHMIYDLLAHPGFHDLTATVNWTAVEKIGERHLLKVVDFKSQDKFLMDEGLLTQLELAGRKAGSNADKVRLSTTAREMILPDGMAAKFQVMVQRRVN